MLAVDLIGGRTTDLPTRPSGSLSRDFRFTPDGLRRESVAVLRPVSGRASGASQWGFSRLGFLLLIENVVVQQFWRRDMGQNQRRAGFGNNNERAVVAQSRLVQFHRINGDDVHLDRVPRSEFCLKRSIGQQDFACVVSDEAGNKQQGIGGENQKERHPHVVLSNPEWPVELEQDCEEESEGKGQCWRDDDPRAQAALVDRDLVPMVDIGLRLNVGSAKRFSHSSF